MRVWAGNWGRLVWVFEAWILTDRLGTVVAAAVELVEPVVPSSASSAASA